MKYRTNWEVWKDIFYVWNVDNGTLIPLVDVLWSEIKEKLRWNKQDEILQN